ncbi:hypothetical protein SEUCBS139899_004677 [Sporothrix eucalyptigena]
MAAAASAQLRFLTDAAHLMRQAAPKTSAHLMSRRIDLASTPQATDVAAATAPIAALPQTDTQRQHVCTSCGLILIPGSDGTTLTIQSGRPSQKKNKDKKKLDAERKRKRDDKTGEASDKEKSASKPAKAPHAPVLHAGITKVYTCGLCSRETRIALPPPPPLPRHRKPKAMQESKIEDENPAPVQTTATVTTKTPDTPATAALPTSSATATTTASGKASTNASSKKRAKNRKAGLLALLDKSRSTDNSGLNLNLSFDDFRMK